jgi:hypothetical protein
MCKPHKPDKLLKKCLLSVGQEVEQAITLLHAEEGESGSLPPMGIKLALRFC